MYLDKYNKHIWVFVIHSSCPYIRICSKWFWKIKGVHNSVYLGFLAISWN